MQPLPQKVITLPSNQAWSIVEIPLKYHRGRHAKDYHEWALGKIKTGDELARGDKNKFLQFVNIELRQALLADPSILNKK